MITETERARKIAKVLARTLKGEILGREITVSKTVLLDWRGPELKTYISEYPAQLAELFVDMTEGMIKVAQ